MAFVYLIMAFRCDIFSHKKFAEVNGIMSTFRTIGNVVGLFFS